MFIVTEKAQRPGDMDGKSGKCFYCREEIGKPHKQTCVLLKKKVKVKATIEYEVDVPASWDVDQIEFHRNEGSWCADNMLDELEKLAKDEGCLCACAVFECDSSDGEAYLSEG